MHDEEDVALVKRGFEAAMGGDYDGLRTLPTDDVSFLGPFQPEAHGADADADADVASMKQCDERARELGTRWEHEDEEFWADETRVVMLHRMKLTRDGRTFDTHEVEIVELRDGKACKLTEYTSEPEKLSEMMS